MSHNDANDREFDDLLAARDSELARLYRKLPQAEPDARLDAAVLAMAHRALNPHLVAASRAMPRKRRAPAWLLGVGSAAGVVMAAGIAWQMRSGFDERAATEAMRPSSSVAAKPEMIAVTPILHDAAPPAPPPPPALQAPPPPKLVSGNAAPARAASAEKPLPEPMPDMKQKPREERMQEEVPVIAKRDAQEDAKDSATAPVPFPQGAKEQDQAGRAARELLESSVVTTTGSIAGADKARLRFGEGLNSVERKSAIAAGQRVDAGVDADKAKKEQSAPTDNLAADAIAKSVAGPAMESELAVAAAASATPAAAAPAPAAPAAPAASTPAMAGASRPAASFQLERNALLPAPDWQALIERLLKEGKRDEAIDNLERFRVQYPDHRLPKKLRDLRR